MTRTASTQLPEGDGALGRALDARRRARKIPLKRLHDVTDLSLGHLSRFLTGKRTAAWEAAERIAAEVQMDPGELMARAGRLPEAVQAALVDTDLAHALIDADYRLPAPTRDLLRRVSVYRLTSDAFGEPPRGEAPDPERELVARDYAPEPAGGPAWRRPRVEFAGSIVRYADLEAADVRFQLAHALGHIHLGHSPGCNLHERSQGERDATAFASFFLIPPRRLEAELRILPPGLNFSDADGFGAALRAVGSALDVPAWLLVQRLADDGQPALLAGVAG